VLSIVELCATNASGFRLEGVSFAVEPGERVAVLGPNGSGKSFLLRLVVGLEAPRSGTIAWSGTTLSGPGRVAVPPEERPMGVIFQDVALFPTLDVRANVALGLPRRTPSAEARGAVGRALETARVATLRDRSVLALSGGEQQRVALARALVRRPSVLLLDEPFHSLDGPVKREILGDLLRIVRDERMAALLVTHDTGEAAEFSDRVVLLRAGHVVQQGAFEDIYDRPADRAAAEFLGPVQAIATDRARQQGIALPAGHDAASLCFRPEQLVLAAAAPGLPADATVERVRPMGAFDDVIIKLRDGGLLLSRARAGTAPPIGQGVSAQVARALAWPGSEELAT
jgi:ABC-type Fe3+/spermidine/putrescine transport system ATPase subunit